MSVPPEEVLIEGPHWNYRLDPSTQLSFEVEGGLISGQIEGSLTFDGRFGLRNIATGTVVGIEEFSTRFSSEEIAPGASLDLLYV